MPQNAKYMVCSSKRDVCTKLLGTTPPAWCRPAAAARPVLQLQWWGARPDAQAIVAVYLIRECCKSLSHAPRFVGLQI